MIKIPNFCGIFATLFVTTTMVLLASCSQDDDNYDSDMYTLAEMGTRLGGGGDPGGGTNPYPSKSEISNNPDVLAKMLEVWNQTIASAEEGARREFGFYIKYNQGVYTFGDVFSGEPAGHNEHAHITLPGTNDPAVCAVFHTHTSLINCDSTMERNVGPSREDYRSNHARLMPCFVYDYQSGPIMGGQAPDSPGALYSYGQERRVVYSNN